MTKEVINTNYSLFSEALGHLEAVLAAMMVGATASWPVDQPWWYVLQLMSLVAPSDCSFSPSNNFVSIEFL